jgi:hypothetical protein
VLVALACALVVSACGEDASQRVARQALQAQLESEADDGGYRIGDVHCSRGARVYFNAVRTTRFICTARRRDGGDCDRFRVELVSNAAARVALERRRAGCVLPGM